MPAAYRVYILQNHAGKFYIGLSDDVARRVAQHRSITLDKRTRSLDYRLAE
ncbi:MAG: hypothetical protein DME48_13820 [Verrucomicrobia bacterium]|nr:MAG: hypothetical protein DME48_13820 [Verrucomicrobiota bacterium]